MKIKTVTVCSHTNDPGYKRLIKSLDHFNYDHHTIVTKWMGFGTKIIETYKYLSTLEGYDYVLFIDAFDVIFVRPEEMIVAEVETIKKDFDCIFSTEKACWPDSNKADEYPPTNSPWKYLNSGSYLFKIDRFTDIVYNNIPDYADDDQRYFTNLFLDGKMNCILDVGCDIFQSVAFKGEGDFSVTDDSFKNLVTGTRPSVLHGNGKTNLEEYEHLTRI